MFKPFEETTVRRVYSCQLTNSQNDLQLETLEEVQYATIGSNRSLKDFSINDNFQLKRIKNISLKYKRITLQYN